MALSLFVPIRAVVLTPGHRDVTGYCSTTEGVRGRLEDALVDAAGPAADVLSGRFSDRWRRHVPRAWANDFASMRAAGFSGPERRALVDFAAALLHGQLACLHARITDALLEHDLGPEDLEALRIGEPLPDQ